MARKARQSREDFREQALAAAEAIIAEQGVENLTVRRVAERIGYSVGSLYNSFANVDELILNLDARTLDLLHDALRAATRSGVPDKDLRALLDSYLRFIEANPNRWGLLFEEHVKEMPVAPDWYLKRVDQLFTLLEEILAPLFGPGEEEQLSRAARLLWVSLHGVWSLAAGNKLYFVSTEPVQSIAQAMVDIFVAGLRARSRG